MALALCNKSGLMLPKEFIEDKEAMIKNLHEAIEKKINENQHRDRYFLKFHSRFDKINPYRLIQKCKVSEQLPPFVTNSIVYWVDNRRGLCEWLWTVSPNKKIEFNKTGIAYLAAKGAMPTKMA